LSATPAAPDAATVQPDTSQFNGLQTTGRQYRNLSAVEHTMSRDVDQHVLLRDGGHLLADVYRPVAQGKFPVLIAASPYPRQVQDLGAPTAIIEAGNSEFFVSRGYVHVIANLRGTGGSSGEWGFFDEQERLDLYDLVEWAAGQPWSDGNIGMIGISYFAIAQIGAAAALEGGLPIRGHFGPVRGRVPLRPVQLQLHLPVADDDRGHRPQRRFILARSRREQRAACTP
jgi:uncharacterized protein